MTQEPEANDELEALRKRVADGETLTEEEQAQLDAADEAEEPAPPA